MNTPQSSITLRQRLQELQRVPTMTPTVAWLCALVISWSVGLWLTATGHFAWGFALQTLAAYFSFTCGHEAAHGAASGNEALNYIVGFVTGLLLFPGSFHSWRTFHKLHHAAANDPERDPDFFAATGRVGEYNTGVPVAVRTTLHGILIYPLLFCEALLAQTGVGALLGARKGDLRRTPRELVSTSFHFLLVGVGVGICIYYDALMLVVTAYLAPALLAASILSLLFSVVPHHDLHDTPQTNRLRTAANLRLSKRWAFFQPVLDFVLSNQTLHAVHHAVPRVPFYRYHEALQILEELHGPDSMPTKHFPPLEIISEELAESFRSSQ